MSAHVVPSRAALRRTACYQSTPARLWRRLGAAGIVAVAVSMVIPLVSAQAAASPTPIPAGADALAAVNYYRAMAGLSPVASNPSWVQGARNHSCYMLYNGMSHDETPGRQGYTTDGDSAGNRGNVAVTSAPSMSERKFVELWMTGPFHSIGVLRHNLGSVGYGQCELAATPKWHSGATLEVISGLVGRPRPATPIVWPGNGTTTNLDRFVAESPNPVTMCGWPSGGGLPLVAMMPEVPVVLSSSVTGPSGPLETCALWAGNVPDLTAKAILAGDNAVTVLPRNPLEPGTYSATIVTAARTVTWSFAVDPSVADGVASAPPTTAPPNTTPPATTPVVDTDVTGTPGGFGAVAPYRVADTRSGLAGPRLTQGTVRRIQVTGQGGVPPGASAVSANFTTVDGQAPGFLSAYACTPNVPNVSTVNFAANAVVANAAIVPLDPNGGVCVFSNVATDVVIDINGYVSALATGRYVPTEPLRLFDTRTAFRTSGRLAEGQTIEVVMTGSDTGVPGNAQAVVINLTAVDASAKGFVTAYPCSGERPLASSLNPGAGEVRPNTVVVPLSTTGTVCFFSLTAVDLVADLSGYISIGGDSNGLRFNPLTATRLVDTRDGQNELNLGSGGQPVAAGSIHTIKMAGARGIPGNATAVSINITGTESAAPGYVTIWPCSEPRPVVSALNVTPDDNVANGAQATLSAGGTLCVYSMVQTHLVIDISGYWAK